MTKSQEWMVSEGNDFAFSLFRNVYSSPGSLVIAPFSLQRALGIVQNGATGETRTEMLSVLGFDGSSASEVNDYYKSLSSQLLPVDNKINLSAAEAMFLNNSVLTGFSVKDSFKEVVEKNYNANVQAMDFSESEKVKNDIKDHAWIQGVRQNVRLDVNQRGTKADAVTVVPVVGYSSNIPLSFYANHTFMYVIREISTGAILFMGVYDGD